MSPSRRPVPELLLERYLAEDLPPTTQREVEALLERSPEARERLEQLRLEREDFVKRHPLPLRPSRGVPAPRWRWAMGVVPAAMAAGLALWLLPRATPPASPLLPGTAKGPGLELRSVPCEQESGTCVQVESSEPGWAALVDGEGHGWSPPHTGDGLRHHLLRVPPEAASRAVYVLFSADRLSLEEALEEARRGEALPASPPRGVLRERVAPHE